MKLLIVEDSASQRMLLKSILRMAGYDDLWVVASADEAFHCLGMNHSSQVNGAAEIDLILMDIKMPGLDGIEACRRIKADGRHHDIPIIMVTGHTEITNMEAAFAAGAIDYITKPLNKTELLARVRSVLQLKKEMDRRKARERQLIEVNEQLRAAQKKSEQLLLNILPEPIAARLKQGEAIIADSFAEVTVLFADIENFTRLSDRMPPEELVAWLNVVFSVFDRLAEKHALEKIKTIGDAYMVVGGLPTSQAHHVEAVADMALDMRREWANLANKSLGLRIGVHTGPVVAGVIGTKKFSYDLWGDTVNLASRMESQGVVDRIQVTAEVYDRLRHTYLFEERGLIEIKGKGDLMTYFLVGRKENAK